MVENDCKYPYSVTSVVTEVSRGRRKKLFQHIVGDDLSAAEALVYDKRTAYIRWIPMHKDCAAKTD